MTNIAFALILSVFGSSGMLASAPRIMAHQVEGYMDQAPAGSQVIDQFTVTLDGKDRQFVVTSIDSRARVEARSISGAYATLNDGIFQLGGSTEDANKMISSPYGSHVSGTFIQMRYSNQLSVQSIETAEPKAAAAAPADDSRS